MKVAQEMLYTGGNCWVLERIEVIDNKKVYFRLSDTAFSRSLLSYDDIQLNIYDDSDNDYWEVGACNWEDGGWQWDELCKAGWFTIFNEMLDSWKANDRRLKLTKKVTPIADNYKAEVDRVGLLNAYIDAVERQYDIGTEEATQAWYNIDWTIGFAGMSITVKNCAAVYNAIQSLIEDYKA